MRVNPLVHIVFYKKVYKWYISRGPMRQLSAWKSYQHLWWSFPASKVSPLQWIEPLSLGVSFWYYKLESQSNSKKSCRNAAIVLSIVMKNGIDPWNLFNFWVWPLKIFEVKGGQYAKKLEFGQTKKISIYQLFKTRICAFMTYVQFRPKSSSNLRSVLWDSRVRGHRPETSNL